MRFFSPSLAFGAVLIAGVSTALYAQDQSQPQANPPAQPAPPEAGHRHAPNPNREAKRMAQALSLSADQQSRIEPILADRSQQISSVRADSSLSPDDRRARMKSIAQNSDGKIQAVLTDPQRQQYEQMKQDRRARRHPQPEGGAPSSN